MTEPRDNPVTQQWQPRDELEAFGLRFVQACNDHDLSAGLAMCDPEIRAMPSRATGTVEGYRGHDGIREWFRTVGEQAAWFEILVSSIQRVERRDLIRHAGASAGGFLDLSGLDSADGSQPVTVSTLAMFGDVYLDGEPLSPWASVGVIRNGLIVRHRSYLSTRELMDEIGLIPDAVRAPGSDS